VLAALGAGAWMLRTPAPAPAPVMAAVPHAPAVSAATMAPAGAAASTVVPAAPFDPLAALQQVVDGASGARAVAGTSEKSQVRIDKDRLTFAIHADHAGYVYLEMVGSDRNNFYMLFPNAVDQNNRIKAGETLVLPRPKWAMQAFGPAGVDQFVAIVSDAPRTFDAAGLAPGDPFSEFPIGQAQALQRAYSGATPLFAGKPACAVGAAQACSPVYGASKFSIEEVR
jgi:hypothetical protein